MYIYIYIYIEREREREREWNTTPILIEIIFHKPIISRSSGQHKRGRFPTHVLKRQFQKEAEVMIVSYICLQPSSNYISLLTFLKMIYPLISLNTHLLLQNIKKCFFSSHCFFCTKKHLSLYIYIYINIFDTLGLGVGFPPWGFHQELAPLSAELDEEELRAIRKALESGAGGSHQEGKPGGGGR